ncbi:hypothetical protein OIU74_027084, partial [Salix koriyanagi]
MLTACLNAGCDLKQARKWGQGIFAASKCSSYFGCCWTP